MSSEPSTSREPTSTSGASSSASANRAWRRPVIRDLGSVRDRVRGGGKSAVNLDADPQSNTKSGGG